MKLLLDTNRYTDLARGEPSVVVRCETAEQLFLSVIVLGELRTGFAGGSRGRENEREFERFLARPNAEILLLDEATSVHTRMSFIRLGSRAARSPRTTCGSPPRPCSTAWRSTRGTVIFSTFPA